MPESSDNIIIIYNLYIHINMYKQLTSNNEYNINGINELELLSIVLKYTSE